MKRFRYSKPMRVEDANLDDIFPEETDSWQLKAERMIRRRERRLRNQMLQY